MARKIYIGQTYSTKIGGEFTVVSIEKGAMKNGRDRQSRQPRIAVDKDGKRLKITNLLTLVNQQLNR
jgi:hypothetical protein